MDEADGFFDAIKKGNAADVSRLLDGNPALARAKQSGASALLTAVYYRQPAVTRILLDRGAAPDVFEASAVGDVERLRALLAEDPARANEFAPDGFTPLGLASFFGHPAAARLLLASGADPNQAARNGTRVAPLHSAVAGGERRDRRGSSSSTAPKSARARREGSLPSTPPRERVGRRWCGCCSRAERMRSRKPMRGRLRSTWRASAGTTRSSSFFAPADPG